jgi:RNA polymerase sigma-32 factor
MDDRSHRQFIKIAMNAPYLEREDEFDLSRRWREQGDLPAMHRLAHAHMRLVISVAGRFRQYGLLMSDMIQEGHVGLLEAAARFEASREVRFSTYATWWIRASIQDYVLRNWSIVRGGTSSGQKALFFNLRRLRAKLTRDGQDHLSSDIHEDIARALGVSKADVATMDHRLSGSDISLDAPMSEADGDGGAERLDFLPDTGILPDEMVGEMIDTERRMLWLKSALGVLSERELQIINERRLQDVSESMTLETLGARLGISKERVRQIEIRALQKLKVALVEQHPDFERV